jgi:hypothetical protein
MVEPRSYPRIIGRAMMLEPDAFERMADDDAPFTEGLFLVALVGLVVGLAKAAGGLLLTLALPSAAAVQPIAARLADALQAAAFVRAPQALEVWELSRWLSAYDTGWARLYPIAWQPFSLVIQWLLGGLFLYLFARALGGQARLPATLGAAALFVAPHVLQVAEVMPFLSVPSLLLFAWGTLMLYRAAQAAHRLSWRSAATAAALTVASVSVVSALTTVLGYALFQWVR